MGWCSSQSAGRGLTLSIAAVLEGSRTESRLPSPLFMASEMAMVLPMPMNCAVSVKCGEQACVAPYHGKCRKGIVYARVSR